MADPDKIEVGDTVAFSAWAGQQLVEVVVISLPDNQLDFWRVRGTSPDQQLVYVSKTQVAYVRLIKKL